MDESDYEKVLVCSAWPYVHNLPHLGNLVGCLLSGDVLARFYRLKGKDVLYVSGSDSHGTRIEFEAEREGVNPKKIAFRNHKRIKELLKDYNIKFDNYSITESKTHKKFVRKFYKNLEKRGYLIKKVEKHAYCENCKRFLADRFIEGKCPYCGYEKAQGNQCEACQKLLEPEELIEPRCAICGSEKIKFKKSKHWYLDLKKLEPQIKDYIKTKAWEGKVKNLTEGWLKEGLKPRAITRDLEWGIKAPFEDSKNKVIYVWAEAVLGYLSATKELDRLEEFWKGNGNIKQIYTLGKDNVPFHSIILPGLLVANEENWHLPDQIVSTEYLNWEEGKPFSKSRGIGLFIDEALEILEPEYWRFYLLYYRPEKKDVNFSWKTLEDSINNILIGNFANFIHRTLTFTRDNFGGSVKGELDSKIKAEIKKTGNKLSEYLKEGKIRKGLREVMNLSSKGNKYFQKKKPWENEDKNVLYNCCQLVKALGIYMYPFMPSASEEIFEQLDLDKEKLRWEEASEYEEKFEVKEPKPLFEKIDKNILKEKYRRMKQGSKMERVDFEDFQELDLRIGKIKEVKDIKDSDKLYKLKIDIGGETRTSAAGLKKHYNKEELKGKQVAVIANLERAEIMGITSEAMVLAAVEDGVPVLLKPDKEVEVGSEIK